MGKFWKSKNNRVAIAIGLFAAAMHAIWAITVAMGIAQTYLDWIFPLHFISNLYTVMPFNAIIALLLIAVAFVAGYLVTWLFIGFWKLMKLR